MARQTNGPNAPMLPQVQRGKGSHQLPPQQKVPRHLRAGPEGGEVRVCKHVDSYPDYYVHVPCGLEHLGCSGGWESHCKKCKRYFTTDPCGSTDGEDGWSYER